MKKFFIVFFSLVILLQPTISFANTKKLSKKVCFYNSMTRVLNGFIEIGGGIKKAVNCARNMCEDADIEPEKPKKNIDNEGWGVEI